MAYWWVNHKQTHTQELEGGYIWSPQTNKNGSRNQTYINLTKTSIGDTLFSYANAAIKATGLVEASFTEAEKPTEFGIAGDQWDKQGWLVRINWKPLPQPLKPKEHLQQISPLLPSKHSPIQQNGNGNQGCYLAAISDALGSQLIALIAQSNPDIRITLDLDDRLLEDERVEAAILAEQLPETEKVQLIKSRRGQGLFRMRVAATEHGCRLTGVADGRFLIASHIKPWRDCNNTERLDGNNGLLLSPHVDKLFDQGWISFADDGSVLIVGESIKSLMSDWGLDSFAKAGSFSPAQKEYLAFHRTNIFRG